VGWWLRKSHDRQDRKEVQAPVSEPAAAPGPPAVAAEEIEAAMEEAAAEAAKRLDEKYRLAHSANELIESTQLNADWIQALAQGDLDAVPDTLPAEPVPESSPSYQSLYDSLYAEALEHLRKTVSREEFTRQAVKDAARRWEEGKRAQLEKELTETLKGHLAPARQRR
jgi:hypothetical protein